jgi:hypothetical protein
VPPRRCSRSACSRAAVATLTYAYAESTAVLGPLAPFHEPHSYDLCAAHADRLSVPLGWEVVRLPLDGDPIAVRSSDDLEALADAVREAARPTAAVAAGSQDPRDPLGRRGHLRALPTHS